jgi:hypothetical protein
LVVGADLRFIPASAALSLDQQSALSRELPEERGLFSSIHFRRFFGVASHRYQEIIQIHRKQKDNAWPQAADLLRDGAELEKDIG